MTRKLLIVIFFISLYNPTLGQNTFLKGIVVDSVDKKPLVNANVLLLNKDSILITHTRTDKTGHFSISGTWENYYELRITYPKMADYLYEVNLNSYKGNKDLGTIQMVNQSILLDEVMITASQKMRLKGDTLIYDADSYNPGENSRVEDLLKRLPGVVVDDNGKIKANGKDVNKVLVDGDEFISDDPLLATRYLKSRSVKEVEIYDEKSKKSQATGINDNRKEKVINLKLKEEYKIGYLGELNLRKGTKRFDSHDAMGAYFNNKLKAGIAAQYTKTDTVSKGFGKDIEKATKFDLINDNSSNYNILDNSAMKNIGNMVGLPTRKNISAFFTNKWNEEKSRINIGANLTRDEVTNNENSSIGQLLPDGKFFNNQIFRKDNKLLDGKFINAQYSTHIDTLTSLNFNFISSEQNYTKIANENNFTRDSSNQAITDNNREEILSGDIFFVIGNVNITKKFKDDRRALLLNIQPGYKKENSENQSTNHISYFDRDSLKINQLNYNRTYKFDISSIAADLSYTEPISKKILFSLYYGVKSNTSEATQDIEEHLIDSNSNVNNSESTFKNTSFSQIAESNFQLTLKKFAVTAGVKNIYTSLKNQERIGKSLSKRTYMDWAPKLILSFSPSSSTFLGFTYDGFTQQPSTDQLQPLLDNTNPLFLVQGNSDLRPSFTNNFLFSLENMQLEKQQVLFFNLNFRKTNNVISTSQKIDNFNRTELTFINVDGNRSLTGYLGFSKSFEKNKFNFSSSINFSLNRDVSLLNEELNLVDDERVYFGNTVNFYPFKILSVTYSHMFDFRTISSSLLQIYEGRQFSYKQNLSTSIQLPKDFKINCRLNSMFQPKGSDFHKTYNYHILSSSISKTFNKSNPMTVQFSVNNILDQSNGFFRNISSNYIKEQYYSFIPRYFAIEFNWSLSKNQ